MGHSVAILTHGDEDRIVKVADDNGISVYTLCLRPFYSRDHGLRVLASFLYHLPPTLMRMRSFLRQNQIEVVNIHYPGIYEIYFLFLKLVSSIKYVISIHGSDIRIELRENWFANKSVSLLIRKADGLTACSRSLLDDTHRILGRLPQRSRAIYIGIDPDWAVNCSPGGHSHGRRYILSLAWAVPVKGPDVLINAFSRLKDRYPDVDLIMVGSGPDEKKIVELIESKGLSGRIIRLGNVDHDEIPSLISNSLFGVIPSRNEGFGSVSLEFQLLKKAVIATNVGGLPESITDGVNGLLTPSEDARAMADKIAYLIDNPRECQRMGDNGYDRVISSFTLDRTGTNLDALFREVALKDARKPESRI
jgi:glycosyltransferase involved in cell wall biosynthesis